MPNRRPKTQPADQTTEPPAEQHSPTAKPVRQAASQLAHRTREILREVDASYPHNIHPALVPGISVDEQRNRYGTDKVVFGVTAVLIVAFLAWGVFDTEGLKSASQAALNWTVTHTGWMFTLLVVVILFFLGFIALSRYGSIPLGKDDEEPEFSKFSWVAMMFSAGIGIGIIFFGPFEPLTYYQAPAPGAAEAETPAAAVKALSQVFLHWGIGPWAIYGLVGAAVAYGSYRRGRVPLMSAILAPLLGKNTSNSPIGRLVDMFAIVATLFGTAASLGIGATQIGRGVEIVAGIGALPNAALIIIVAVLTCGFIASAVSGVSKGIRWLSNINLTLALVLAVFIFLAGPTLFVLNLIPSALLDYLANFFGMLGLGPAYGEAAASFTGQWTVFYWAWWISWSPFVGIFLAKISRGRTLREYVIYVITLPTSVCMIAFAVLGGTAIWMRSQGEQISSSMPAQDVFFGLLQHLPLHQITPILAMVLISIFFITSADSASLVMGTLSQRGRSEPAKSVTVFWGLCMMGIAMVMLLIGGSDALAGLQNLIVVTALPFAIILFVMMIAFAKDLRTDPLVLRRAYATSALRNAVAEGIDQYGDDFQIAIEQAPEGEGAGANIDSHDAAVTDWYQRTDEDGEPVEYDYSTGEYADGWVAEDGAANQSPAPEAPASPA